MLPSRSAGAAQPAGTPIKIGYISQGQIGPTVIDEIPVFSAWVKWTNADGGLDGHPVQLITATEPGDVAVATTDVQKLLGDGIVALFDEDGNDAAWSSMVEKANVAVFSGVETLTFAGSDDSFGLTQTPLITPDEDLMAAKKIGASKLALLYCTEYSSCAQAVPFYKAEGEKYGVDIVYNAAVSGSSPNYLAQCLAAKAAGANSVFVASTSDVGLRVLASCAKQGYTPHLITAAGAYQKSFAGAPGTNGMIVGSGNVPFFDTANPAIATMTKVLNHYDPSITKSGSYTDTAVWNWASGTILEQAVKAANLGPSTTITPTALRDALFTLHTTTAGGLSPGVTFTQGKPETNSCFYYAGMKNGKFSLPYGLKVSCIPAS